jgi:hypothetical protein
MFVAPAARDAPFEENEPLTPMEPGLREIDTPPPDGPPPARPDADCAIAGPAAARATTSEGRARRRRRDEADTGGDLHATEGRNQYKF